VHREGAASKTLLLAPGDEAVDGWPLRASPLAATQNAAFPSDVSGPSDVGNVGRSSRHGRGVGDRLRLDEPLRNAVRPREIPPGATRRPAFWEYFSLVARSPERHTSPSRE
jgi:hypothetical protein